MCYFVELEAFDLHLKKATNYHSNLRIRKTFFSAKYGSLRVKQNYIHPRNVWFLSFLSRLKHTAIRATRDIYRYHKDIAWSNQDRYRTWFIHVIGESTPRQVIIVWSWSARWAKQKTFSVAPLSGTGIGCAVVAIRSGSRRCCGTVSARGLKGRLFGWPRPSVSTDPLSREQTRYSLYPGLLGVSTSHGRICHRLLQYLLSNLSFE